jgi:hypothetical protein
MRSSVLGRNDRQATPPTQSNRKETARSHRPTAKKQTAERRSPTPPPDYNGQMNLVMSGLRKFARLANCAIVVLHHLAKAENDKPP